MNDYQMIDNVKLQNITGGGKADYNFGYGIGHGIRKGCNGISSWFHQHL